MGDIQSEGKLPLQWLQKILQVTVFYLAHCTVGLFANMYCDDIALTLLALIIIGISQGGTQGTRQTLHYGHCHVSLLSDGHERANNIMLQAFIDAAGTQFGLFTVWGRWVGTPSFCWYCSSLFLLSFPWNPVPGFLV